MKTMLKLVVVLAVAVLTLSAWASPYTDAVVSDNPTVYWRLGETSGTTADDFVGTRDGTYIGSPTLGVPGALPYDSDTAMRAGTTPDYMKGTSVSNVPLASNITVEVWVKSATAANWDGYGGFASARGMWGGGKGNGILMRGEDTDRTLSIWFYNHDGNKNIYLSYTPANISNWHYLAATYQEYNGSPSNYQAILYYDGVPVKTNWAVTADLEGGPNFRYGAAGHAIYVGVDAIPEVEPNDITTYTGSAYIDELAIYPTNLTAERILAHYNASQIIPEPGTLAFLLGAGLVALVRRMRCG